EKGLALDAVVGLDPQQSEIAVARDVVRALRIAGRRYVVPREQSHLDGVDVHGFPPLHGKWREVLGHVITGPRASAWTGRKAMTIKRHEPSKILSKVVEANGFVFTAGITADDAKQDAKGQAQQILKEIDRLLALCGADKSKVVSATIWVSDIRHRDAMNE